MKRILAFVALFIFVVFILLLAFSPKITRNYINKNGVELTGRKLLVDKIKMNFFTTTLQVIDFKMYEENGSDIFVDFDTLLINVKPLRLLKHEIHIEQFLMVNPWGQILHNDTLFNFTDLIEFYASADTSVNEKMEENKEPYRLNLNQLELSGGGFRYTDVGMSHSMEFNELSFLIPHIYWGKQEKSKADVNFKLGRGGSFSSSFNYDTGNGDFEGIVEVSKLDLKVVLPYLQEYINFSNIDGTLSSEIRFTGNEQKMDELSLKGNARLDSVKIKDMQNKTVLGVDAGKAILKEFKPLKYHVEIDTVQLDNPYAYFALIDSISNFEKMLVVQVADSGNEEEPDIEEQIILNNFIINKGLVDFSDQRLYEVFNYELSQITADMDTISLQDDWINLNAKMKLNKRGDLAAKVGMNPMNPMNKVSVEYVISDFQLPDINIYSKHYTGLPILFGDMYYVGNTTIKEGQLESKNELIIRNVEMGRKTGGLYDVPIKLALFILKDINGDIVLDIPVSGDLSDPQTNVRAIVWDTFKGFMFKIVASPFKAFGNLLGAEPKDLEEITMNYGDTLLLSKQERNLDLLLELEELKPELQIEMQYLNDKKLERTDVAAVYMQNSFYEEHNKKAGNNRKDYLNYLAKTSGKDSMLIQDYELLLTPEEVVDSIIQDREQLRLKLVKDYFAIHNDSSTIEVLDYNTDDVLNIGSRPRFAIKYSLAEDQNVNDSIRWVKELKRKK